MESILWIRCIFTINLIKFQQTSKYAVTAVELSVLSNELKLLFHQPFLNQEGFLTPCKTASAVMHSGLNTKRII